MKILPGTSLARRNRHRAGTQGLSAAERAFTLLEMLVSVAIFLLLIVLLAGGMDAASKIWVDSNRRISQFRESRRAVETIRNGLSQATLGTYWDYKYTGTGAAQIPEKYVRQSNLRFISAPVSALSFPSTTFGTGRPLGEPVGQAIFFQAPLGVVDNQAYRDLPDLLNTVGYFVSYGEADDNLPDFVESDARYPKRTRFRLFQFVEPSENLTIYQYTSGRVGNVPSGAPKNDTYTGREWLTAPLATAANSHLVAENIVAIALRPRLADGTELSDGTFVYDSTVETNNPKTNPRHQLPPVVDMTVVAVDEASMVRYPNLLTPSAMSLNSRFKNPSAYETDLAAIEKYFLDNKIKYKLFRTSISILGAKWSTEQ